MSIVLVFACVVGSYFSTLSPIITFYDRDATIELLGTSTLNVKTTTLRPVDGTILKEPGASIIGSSFYFNDGILTDGDFEVLLTATYDSTLTTSITLNGSTGAGDASYFVLNPGLLPHRVLVKGSRNRFEGLPAFVNSDAITLFDAATTLTISVQRTLDQHLVMNGGTIVLDDALLLDDFVLLKGPGKVIFDNNNLTIGKKDLLWTSTIVWQEAQNLILGARATIYGQWIFDGDAHIIGNDNTIDLTYGGTIWVKKNTKLRLSNIKIDGLGSGNFVFEDKTSEIQLFRCGIDINRNYTFTTGGVIVEGPTAIVTRDKLMTFAQNASLTVDGIHCLYDTLDYLDKDNIRTFTELGTNNLGLINGGVIRRVTGDRVGDFNVGGPVSGPIGFDNNQMVTRRKNLIINTDSVINGQGQNLVFSRLANEPIFIIKSGVNVEFQSIMLKDLPVVHIEQQVGSQLIFGEDTTIELGENGVLNSVWEFKGLVLLNGRNKTIEFGPSGKFVLRPGTTLFMDSLSLKGIKAGSIVCYDTKCTVSFGDVAWEQDASFSFTQGHFDVLGQFSIEGTGTFAMTTAKQCTVQSFGELIVNRNTTFLYAPPSNNRDLFRLTGTDSTLFLNGGTLASTTTGLRLTSGTLMIDSKSFLRNDGAKSVSQGISFGNGVASKDLTIKVEPAATLELLSGVLAYQNVN